jgi:hypothetical protein
MTIGRGVVEWDDSEFLSWCIYYQEEVRNFYKLYLRETNDRATTYMEFAMDIYTDHKDMLTPTLN